MRVHRQGRRGVLLNLEPFQVTPEPAFYADVKALLGADAFATLPTAAASCSSRSSPSSAADTR